MFNLAAPPGFQGFDPLRPVHFYVRHLPHWRQAGATYYVTFRLADSLPANALNALRSMRRNWQRMNSVAEHKKWERLAKEIAKRYEFWLDQGSGSCILRDSKASQVIAETLHYFDEERYILGSYVVMSNHVHAIIKPLSDSDSALETLLQSWKRHSATRINRHLQTKGPLWQEESYDRIVRDEEHLYRCIQYIGSNAARAGLSPDLVPRWVRPGWENLGWGFEAGPTRHVT